MSFEFHRFPLFSFPDVVIHAEEHSVRTHPAYKDAKTGDSDSAYELVHAFLSPSATESPSKQLAGRNVIIVAVHAVEREGVNAIPEAMADVLSARFNCKVDTEIVQTNIVSHTKADGFSRLARQPVFSGNVCENADYILVDDFVGMGSTLANLRGWILHCGGKVLHATVLTGQPRSSKFEITKEIINEIREKHGKELESWWRDTFGFAYDSLTHAEAGYLLRTSTAERIRNRITQKIKEGSQ